MKLYQSINQITNFYLEDIQKAIENCQNHLNVTIERIQEIEITLEKKHHTSAEIQQLIAKNNHLLADNCLFIAEQNKLIERYQQAIKIVRHKDQFLQNNNFSSISEDIQFAFQEMLNFYKEKNMTENVMIIENFISPENKVFTA